MNLMNVPLSQISCGKTVGLALLSANLLKHIAEVIIEFLKRNDSYTIEIGDIKITKDNASARDMERIGKQLRKIMVERQKSKKLL